jgi:hypothetical protein
MGKWESTQKKIKKLEKKLNFSTLHPVVSKDL